MRTIKTLMALAGVAVLLLAGCTTKEQEIAVTGVSLSPSKITLKVGESQSLTAEVQPSNASDKKVSWSSDDPDMDVIALNDGTVKGVGKGKATVTVTTNDGGFKASCEVTVSDAETPDPGPDEPGPGPDEPIENPEVPVKSISMDPSSATLGVDQEANFHAVIEPADATNINNVEWKASPASAVKLTPSGNYCKVKAVSAGTVTLTASVEGKEAKATITIESKPVEVEGTVDLGLPSGTLWCTENLGTDSSNPVGLYFSWGETDVKSSYDANTYAFGNAWWYDTPLSKYNEDDNLTFLDADDDAASVILGPEYHTPTLGEWAELFLYCDWEWTTQNDRAGYKIKGKNGKSIFLPTTGHYSGTSLEFPDLDLAYWSSTKCAPDLDKAYVFRAAYDTSTGEAGGGLYSDWPYYGLCVRPVYSARPVAPTGITTDETVEVEKGKSYQLKASVKPSSAKQSVVWLTDADNLELTYDGKVTLTNGYAGEVLAIDGTAGHSKTVLVKAKSSYPEPEAVELGLSTKWSSWDLGAGKVGEPGFYFAWGETEPKLSYESENYKWYDADAPGFTAPYGSKTLSPEDDAAAILLKGSWRIPTLAQFEELINKCTIEKLDKDDVNNPYGIAVLKVKGRGDYKNNYIYLPFGGWGAWDISWSYGEGAFYSTTQLSDDINAKIFSFTDKAAITNSGRMYGYCIRPVWDITRSQAAAVRSLGPVGSSDTHRREQARKKAILNALQYERR